MRSIAPYVYVPGEELYKLDDDQHTKVYDRVLAYAFKLKRKNPIISPDDAREIADAGVEWMSRLRETTMERGDIFTHIVSLACKGAYYRFLEIRERRIQEKDTFRNRIEYDEADGILFRHCYNKYELRDKQSQRLRNKIRTQIHLYIGKSERVKDDAVRVVNFMLDADPPPYTVNDDGEVRLMAKSIADKLGLTENYVSKISKIINESLYVLRQAQYESNPEDK